MLPKNIVETISEGYDKCWKAFIKPEKMNYYESSMGPKIQNFGEKYYIRDDFDIKTMEQQNIKASMFYPENNNESKRINQFGFDEISKNLNNIPTLIYLHSQSGSRMEGLFLLDFCAENNYA